MNRIRRTTGLAALAAGGLATVTVLLTPAVAAADPAELVGPLLTSDCTFAQVDAALHDKAPQLAAILDANPTQKAELQRRFDQPVEQRRAEFERLLAENPEAARQAENDPRAAQLRDTIAEVAAVCHQY
ncbi:hemophore-related protein [Nocardia puris]|uniref:Hemophore-related protein n=1 Tax=Nocardia puris TaxID=208602 RepID=A0A366D9Y2_9NOCA|nr:hemophore-related protein [Nocardia puris]MBF6211697.1 hemophore-related protein [Nocardia puris]MBF6365701.1 hemophore-related protein [Nocardia puris]MBF6460657.1 hemophore-related protein [Nocardia puris]RBO86871.1 hemophore-related protein [Nocardia puris]